MSEPKKPFWPDDKPWSFVISIMAGMCALFSGALVFIGHFLGILVIENIARNAFKILSLIAIFTIIFCERSHLSGSLQRFETNSMEKSKMVNGRR